MSDKVYWREHWGSNSLKKEENEGTEDYVKRLIDLINHWQGEAMRLNKICVMFAPTCEGCLENEANQMAHSAEGGCLFIPDPPNDAKEEEEDFALVFTPPSPLNRQASQHHTLQRLETSSLAEIEIERQFYKENYPKNF